MKLQKFEHKIWLASPTMHGEELRYMTEAYESNWMSTIGRNLDEIEALACEKTGRKFGVALSSGTAALHMAVKLMGIRPGEKVFCSDLTFAATVNPIVYEGGIPTFVDSEYDTWNMDPEALEKAFQENPEVRAVVLVHLYGTPAKVDEIKRVCDRHGAVLIEDAAESFGAFYKGRQTGTFGECSILSFNGNKIITGSSGGMFLTDDEEAAARIRKWSTQARENASWYQHMEIGYNYRMSNVIAGVVRGQIPYLQEHIVRKQEIYERYRDGFRNIPVTMNPYEKEFANPNFWLSCLLLEPECMCLQERGDVSVRYQKEAGKTCPTEILEKLLEYNAEGRPIWKPMHLQPVYKDNAFITAKEAEVDAELFQRGLCLPSDIKMSDKEQDTVIEIVKSCFI